MDEDLKEEIEKRVERIIEDDEMPTSDSFATLEGNNQLSLFPPDTYVHELSVDGLRNLSYYLCKSQLFTSSNLSDNYHYWGWTLVCATSIHFPEREFIDAPEGLVPDIVGVLRLLYLRNLENILRNISQQKREQSSATGLPFEFTLSEITPAPHEIRNQLARAAFSTLEATLRRHCKEVDLTGKPIDSGSYNSYIGEYTYRNKVKYEDLLNLWKDHNANPATERALERIQYVFEEDERLISEIEEMAEEYNFEGQSHDIFWLIRNVRNANIHGEIDDSFGPPDKFTYLVINLLCLLFWDSVDDDTFDDNLEKFIALNKQHSSSDYFQRPDDLYYPAFSIQVEYQYPSI